MKRLFLLMLCFFLVAASAQAGAGGNSAKQENSIQAGKSSIYFYDVECKSLGDSNGYGRLVINTAKKTFVFIGQDFTPMQHVHIEVDTADTFELIAQGKSTKTGNLHIQGEWEGTLPKEGTVSASYYYPPAYGFILNELGGYVAHIKVKWSTDGGVTWQTTNDESKDVSLFEQFKMDIKSLDPGNVIPRDAMIKMKMVVVGGDDVVTDETYMYVDYSPPGFCYPFYDSHGPTWNASLDLYNIQCTPYIGSDIWTVWGE